MMRAVLSDPRYRSAAEAIAEEMCATPSVEEALSALLADDGEPMRDL